MAALKANEWVKVEVPQKALKKWGCSWTWKRENLEKQCRLVFIRLHVTSLMVYLQISYTHRSFEMLKNAGLTQQLLPDGVGYNPAHKSSSMGEGSAPARAKGNGEMQSVKPGSSFGTFVPCLHLELYPKRAEKVGGEIFPSWTKGKLLVVFQWKFKLIFLFAWVQWKLLNLPGYCYILAAVWRFLGCFLSASPPFWVLGWLSTIWTMKGSSVVRVVLF